jgi:TRAP-type C4-dicarboxylate transport system permease small subunit
LAGAPGSGRGGPFGRWGTRFYEGLGLLGGLILVVMTVAVFVQVLTRFTGHTALDGIDEIPRYLFVWLVMIGAAAAMHRAEHTRLEYFEQRFSPRGQAVLTVVTNGVGMLLFLSLIRTSFVLVPNSQFQTSAGLGLPLGYVYAAVPVGAVLILLPMAWRLFAALRVIWPRPS